MLEKSVKTACLGWLKSLPNSHFWSNPASRFGAAGRPDIEGVIQGKYVGIECKTPEAYNKKDRGLSPAQQAFEKKIEDAGGMYFVVEGVGRLTGMFMIGGLWKVHSEEETS